MGSEDEREALRITDAMIARRAFEISLTDDTGTPEQNWARAERELREEAAAARGGQA
jgi:hypothetical protein